MSAPPMDQAQYQQGMPAAPPSYDDSMAAGGAGGFAPPPPPGQMYPGLPGKEGAPPPPASYPAPQVCERTFMLLRKLFTSFATCLPQIICFYGEEKRQ